MKKKIILNLGGAFFIIFIISRNALYAQEDPPEGKLFIYEDHGKRDPFWSLVSPSGTIINYDLDYLISDLKLEGIIQGSGNQNMAIINGKIVRVNDKIGQFLIKRIDSSTVILANGQQTFELRLKKEE